MTPAEFENLGMILCGEGWIHSLARIMEINRRSVQRWANGENMIPEGVQDMLCEMVAYKLFDYALLVSGGELPIVGTQPHRHSKWGKQVDAMVREYLKQAANDYIEEVS